MPPRRERGHDLREHSKWRVGSYIGLVTSFCVCDGCCAAETGRDVMSSAVKNRRKSPPTKGARSCRLRRRHAVAGCKRWAVFARQSVEVTTPRRVPPPAIWLRLRQRSVKNSPTTAQPPARSTTASTKLRNGVKLTSPSADNASPRDARLASCTWTHFYSPNTAVRQTEGQIIYKTTGWPKNLAQFSVRFTFIQH